MRPAAASRSTRARFDAAQTQRGWRDANAGGPVLVDRPAGPVDPAEARASSTAASSSSAGRSVCARQLTSHTPPRGEVVASSQARQAARPAGWKCGASSCPVRRPSMRPSLPHASRRGTAGVPVRPCDNASLRARATTLRVGGEHFCPVSTPLPREGEGATGFAGSRRAPDRMLPAREKNRRPDENCLPHQRNGSGPPRSQSRGVAPRGVRPPDERVARRSRRFTRWLSDRGNAPARRRAAGLPARAATIAGPCPNAVAST